MRDNTYNLTTGEVAGFGLRTAALFGLAVSGAYVAYNSSSIAWAVVGLVMLAAGGLVMLAYMLPAWAAWVRHLQRDDAQRIAEIMAITPAYQMAAIGVELARERRALVEAIRGMTPEATDYALRMIDDTGVIVDGVVLKWRLSGAEYPAEYAWLWWQQYSLDSRIPADSDWTPQIPMAREEWRRLASAMANSLAAQGAARPAAGPIAPQWIAEPAARQRALRLTGVISAAALYEAVVRAGEDGE